MQCACLRSPIMECLMEICLVIIAHHVLLLVSRSNTVCSQKSRSRLPAKTSRSGCDSVRNYLNCGRLCVVALLVHRRQRASVERLWSCSLVLALLEWWLYSLIQQTINGLVLRLIHNVISK